MSKLFFIILFILLFQVMTSSAQTVDKTDEDCSGIKYEDHNFLPPDRFIVNEISGQVMLHTSQKPIREICVGLFNEKTKKIIKVTLSNSDGKFSFKGVKKGKYRLIVFDDVLFVCTANIPIEVKNKKNKKKQILVHMRMQEIDTCSYGELVGN